MFSVVKFTDEEDAPGVVLTTWLIDGATTWYPNVKSDAARDKLIQCNAEPNISSWTKHPVVVLTQVDSFVEANRKAKKAEDTSNLSSDEENLKDRKYRKRKSVTYPGEDDTSEGSDTAADVCKEMTIKPLPPPPKKYVKPSSFSPLSSISPSSTTSPTSSNFSSPTTSPTSSSVSKNPIMKFFTVQLPTNPSTKLNIKPISPALKSSPTVLSNAPKSSSCSNLSSQPHFQNSALPKSSSSTAPKEVLPTSTAMVLGQLQETISNLYEAIEKQNTKLDFLASLIQNSTPVQAEEVVISQRFDQLPFVNLEDFQVFDEELKQQKTAKQFVKLLVSVGGKDMKTLLVNIMRRVISCELATQFSYSGKMFGESSKRPFVKTQMCKCIHDAGRKKYPSDATEDSVKQVLSNWLQQAKTRISRRGKGKETTPQQNEEDNALEN